MMEYKGYVAAVEFDDSADILHGRVVNSGPYPNATFEATETKVLRREFGRSVDESLAWCEEDGIEPRKPISGKLNVRLGSELHCAVASAAAAEGLSINSWIVETLRGVAGAQPSPTSRSGRVAFRGAKAIYAGSIQSQSFKETVHACRPWRASAQPQCGPCRGPRVWMLG